ncbi:hypothetical protein CsSME_00019930 [Camellia sinensis var. sinensis]
MRAPSPQRLAFGIEFYPRPCNMHNRTAHGGWDNLQSPAESLVLKYSGSVELFWQFHISRLGGIFDNCVVTIWVSTFYRNYGPQHLQFTQKLGFRATFLGQIL